MAAFHGRPFIAGNYGGPFIDRDPCLRRIRCAPGRKTWHPSPRPAVATAPGHPAHAMMQPLFNPGRAPALPRSHWIDTMSRCAHTLPRRLALRLAFMGLAGLAMLGASSVQAQTHRQFPADALRAEMLISTPPDLQLDGKDARLAPGTRIRGTDNLLVYASALVGQKLTVHYTLDFAGHVRDVWLLNEAELANKTWPRSAEQASAWSFDLASQVWTKP